jgi:flavin reductase (DIM6/NTAB) family NADH-FMN oxidoreductase RutF
MSAADGSKTLASALGRIPSGLFVVTARQGQDETGMLVSWVQQCSFVPPRISVALQPKREVNAWLTPDCLFVVHLLAEEQKDLISRFAKGFALSEPAFTGLALQRDDEGPPILLAALGYLRCRLVQRLSVGDHDLLIGEVLSGEILNEGKPRVHVRKSGLTY